MKLLDYTKTTYVLTILDGEKLRSCWIYIEWTKGHIVRIFVGQNGNKIRLSLVIPVLENTIFG